MRIGGLATGMDIDQLVGKLMKAERLPLDRMEQDKTTITWKRDAFRDINMKLSELDKMMIDMKLSPTYNSKSVTSTQEGSITATGTTKASNGVYNIEVTQLAESAINVGGKLNPEMDPNKSFAEQNIPIDKGSFTFTTYNEKGDAVDPPYEFDVNAEDTLNDVLNRITEADNNVRAFYDGQSNQVVIETTRTGDYNKNGVEIEFDATNTFFTDTLKLSTANEKDGKDATFVYNGALTINSKDNNYSLNGIDFEFTNVTDGNAKLTVDNNVEASFDSIMEFVDKYNEVVETLNETQREEKFREYKPLTDKQRADLSEEEAKLWDEKAKSGILRNESIISEGLFDMRRSWYANVETGGDYTSLTQIGITTSSDYMDGGKLEVNEKELKEALIENPAGVQKLFSNSEEDDSRGIVNRLEDALESTLGRIEERAGVGTDTLENYTLGKRLKDLNEQISDFENRLVRVENRYWGEFTAMEKAIQRMNQQSAQLMSQFGGA